MCTSGSCYGFRIRSAFPLRYLRADIESPTTLEVDEGEVPAPAPTTAPIQSWEAIPGRRAATRLFGHGGGYTVEVGGSTRFRVRPERGHILAPRAGAGSERARRRETLLWMTPASLAVVHRGDLALHAAAVQADGGAALLTAPGGAGKSSLAAAFWSAGHRVLADDFACCRPGEEPLAFPGPALIRLRPDAFERLELREVRVAARTAGRAHLVLDGERRGDGAGVPLRGIFLLHVAPGATEFARVPPEEAVRALWAMSFFLPDDADRARCFRGLGELVGRVPVWRVSRPLEWDRLPEAVVRIADRLASA